MIEIRNQFSIFQTNQLSYDSMLGYNMKQHIIETTVFDVFYIIAIVMFQQYNFFKCSII